MTSADAEPLSFVPPQDLFDRNDAVTTISLESWKEILGSFWFGLPAHQRDSSADTKGAPTFRQLVGYFARRRKVGGLSSIEKNLGDQRPSSWQVSLSYLLGLDWRVARKFQDMRDRKKVIDALSKAIKGVPSDKTTSALADLPLEALRLPPTIIEGLATLGVSRIGPLAAMPRAPLALRFGPDVVRRLDQAFGRIGETIVPVRPVDPVEVSRNFAEPIGAAETIASYIGKLVPLLCQGLDERGQGVRRLDLLLHRVDSRTEAIRVATAMPVRDVTRLTRLLCEKIETIDPGFGIERMMLIASLAEPMDRRQTVSSLIAEEEADVSDLIDTLANRVGMQALYRFAPVESDLPERSFCRVPALAPEETKDWPEHWPRPTRLLARPEPVQAMAELPDQPPLFFIWRGVRRKVKCADGPERVFGEWWKNDGELTIARDYFRVEDTSGERFWLYRAGDGEHGETGSQGWFLHGIFG